MKTFHALALGLYDILDYRDELNPYTNGLPPAVAAQQRKAYGERARRI